MFCANTRQISYANTKTCKWKLQSKQYRIERKANTIFLFVIHTISIRYDCSSCWLFTFTASFHTFLLLFRNFSSSLVNRPPPPSKAENIFFVSTIVFSSNDIFSLSQIYENKYNIFCIHSYLSEMRFYPPTPRDKIFRGACNFERIKGFSRQFQCAGQISVSEWVKCMWNFRRLFSLWDEGNVIGSFYSLCPGWYSIKKNKQKIKWE